VRILKRAGWAIFVVWATVSLTFIVNHALPSDPARMIAGQQAPPAAVAKIRSELGLDRPLYVQYARFLRRLVHFSGGAGHATCASFGPLHVDLGKSYQQRRAVTTILAERMPRTFFLALAAACLQAVLGIGLGVFAASRARRPSDRLAVTMSLLGVSLPTFMSGLALQWLFAYELRWFPIDGYGASIGEHVRSVVLPAITLAVFGAAYYTRFVRDEMIGELGQDYVRTARAKGVSGSGVVLRHALRNALVPIVTLFGLELGALLSGAIVTESVFRWPGIGSLSVDAMLDRDGPVLLGCVLVTSAIVVVVSILVDLAYVLVDPRLRRASP
jgi:peptide/nickel transport system permease protein